MKTKKVFLLVAIFLVAFLLGFGVRYYLKIFGANVKQTMQIYIPTDSSYDDVVKILSQNKAIDDMATFALTARLKKFKKRIYPGRYILAKGMSNNDIVNMLRGGRQTPIKLTFNNIRTLEEFAGKVAKQIEPDSVQILNCLQNQDTLQKYGFTTENILTMFIPDTYEFYWNTSPHKLFKRMIAEYKKFWNEKRLEKANIIGLTPIEVSILASIVQAEQSIHNDEKSTIAGLYINRLNRGMPLESDPTLVFALGNFNIKRVLNKHKEIASPYNTYKNAGLPPGAINMPEKSTLKAVLNYKKHDYIFMCAKEDFSGYHYFSKSLKQHNIYARKYRKALNKNKIYR